MQIWLVAPKIPIFGTMLVYCHTSLEGAYKIIDCFHRKKPVSRITKRMLKRRNTYKIRKDIVKGILNYS